MLKPVTQKLIKELRKSDLPTADRVALTTALLDKMTALPLQKSIYLDGKGVKINGKRLDPDQAQAFKESCVAFRDNPARKVVNHQIRYLAISLGVHDGLNLDTIMFSKAALWCLQQEETLLEQLSPEEEI